MWRLFFCLFFLLFSACSQTSYGGGNSAKAPDIVVLDIGHFIGSQGAKTPGPIDGKIIRECSFWYQYVYDIKNVIEAAGYKCVVINRGNPPEEEPLLSYARRAKVLHLRHPDIPGQRYPSYYHPDRVASGIISADYAIARKAKCVVFLHHNSSSSRWQQGGSPSMILCNKYNGSNLARSLCDIINAEVLNHRMPNKGKQCVPQVRSVDADRSAGWLNACDDSGIPAAVIEAAFLNNRNHAKFLAQDANARFYANVIGRGIVNYLRLYGNEKRHIRADENAPDEGSFGYAEESRALDVPGAKLLYPQDPGA